MAELPVWVWDILIELEHQRDVHPELLFQAGGMSKPERYEWCSCTLLDQVPPEVIVQVRAIRTYTQAKAASKVSWPEPEVTQHEHLEVAGYTEAKERENALNRQEEPA